MYQQGPTQQGDGGGHIEKMHAICKGSSSRQQIGLFTINIIYYQFARDPPR
jgi:hypothetical protein